MEKKKSVNCKIKARYICRVVLRARQSVNTETYHNVVSQPLMKGKATCLWDICRGKLFQNRLSINIKLHSSHDVGGQGSAVIMFMQFRPKCNITLHTQPSPVRAGIILLTPRCHCLVDLIQLTHYVDQSRVRVNCNEPSGHRETYNLLDQMWTAVMSQEHFCSTGHNSSVPAVCPSHPHGLTHVKRGGIMDCSLGNETTRVNV
jgi:hypothetical protein